MAGIFIDHACKIVSSESELIELVSSISKSTPIEIEIEGTKLSRYDTISLTSMHLRSANTTYLLDVETLKEAAFTTSPDGGQALQEILEDSTVSKCL